MNRRASHTGLGTAAFLLQGFVAALLMSAAGVRAEKEGPSTVRSGSGFVIARSGYVVTNAHVVAGCKNVRLLSQAKQGGGTVIAADPGIDLAVIHTSLPLAGSLALRGGPPLRLGESVVVFGFPLTGSLSKAGNLTTGNVSALAGLKDDPHYIQITAPVQPGNSGGPLLDQSGNVIGVVTSKLDALGTAQRTGDIPQNVNFAVNLPALTAFLDAQHVSYDTAVSDRPLAVADIAQSAQNAAVHLLCAAADEPLPPSETVRVSPSPQQVEPTPPAPVPAPLPVPPPGPVTQPGGPIPVPSDAGQQQTTQEVQLVEVRTPYPATAPAVREITVTNRSAFSVLQVTIGWTEAGSYPQCPPALDAYLGTRDLFVSLKPGETTTTMGEFTPQARFFCLLSAQFLPTSRKAQPAPAEPPPPLEPGQRLEVTPLPRQ